MIFSFVYTICQYELSVLINEKQKSSYRQNTQLMDGLSESINFIDPDFLFKKFHLAFLH